jgi:hypothetical protein
MVPKPGGNGRRSPRERMTSGKVDDARDIKSGGRPGAATR